MKSYEQDRSAYESYLRRTDLFCFLSGLCVGVVAAVIAMVVL
ncbi:hypothetical protein NB709_003390 [Xanthomonas sacchari]|nr:hypothetical protein [Xanthomonas sacchari]MCW0413514.1 hypothetical protein [Xanthomonas sacchari]